MDPTVYSLKGNLAFDHGLPAAGITVRLYNIGFAGQDTKLGEAKSDGQGNYAFAYQYPQGQTPNVQLRVLDSKNNEVTISSTKFNAQSQETLDLTVPATVQPLAPEFQRLSADMDKRFGGILGLAHAQEDDSRQDLTLVNQSTNWDSRLLALAATAAQQTSATGLGPDALYALYRVGLPTDSQHLALVPQATVQKALAKASQAGIVGLNDQQIAAATKAFGDFATKTRLAMTAPGAVSNFGDLLKAAVPDATAQTAFANLYFSQPTAGADFWKQAADLQLPGKTLDALKLQGKFLYLTFNNAPLAQKLQQDFGSLNNLSQLADKDYYDGATWKTALSAVAGGDGAALQKLIPQVYGGNDAAGRLEAYAADLARRVRFSFPTQVVARLVEKGDLKVDQASAPKVTTFLRAAAPLGFQLGRTPLNAFLKSSAAALPALDAAATQNLKTLHRLFQLTPSHESLQAALKLGFTSAQQIASYGRDEFIDRFGDAFPSLVEGWLVHRKAQQISSVTFNFFALAKQLDTAPPVYGMSASNDDRQNARNAVVQQFPSMANLFGSLDFCDCAECRSVLSPAAYLVDLLEFLRQSAANGAGYTPLDVLVGKDNLVTGRRPDIAALPLTCENANTQLPYIDLVNETLEYYVAHNGLDPGAAYDTGKAASADLAAEPQHVQAAVYNVNLKNAP
jgi:hypothetical protein